MPMGRLFEPTEEQRENVEILIGNGWSEASIAKALRIDRTTLRKHFSEELEFGRERRRMLVVRSMYEIAVGGNISAQKAYLDRGDLTPEPAPKPKAEKPVRLGKKEAADAVAQAAAMETNWANLVRQ